MALNNHCLELLYPTLHSAEIGQVVTSVNKSLTKRDKLSNHFASYSLSNKVNTKISDLCFLDDRRTNITFKYVSRSALIDSRTSTTNFSKYREEQ